MTGFGIQPQVDLSLGSGEDLCLDMGHAMARDVVSKTFTLLNSSPLQVRFRLSLDSQQPKPGPVKSFSKKLSQNGQSIEFDYFFLSCKERVITMASLPLPASLWKVWWRQRGRARYK